LEATLTVPVFGSVIERPETEVLPLIGADFSKIGIITSSDDADNSVFPLGVAVRFNSRDQNFVAAAKIGTGLLADAVRGINDQLGVIGGSADLIAVRFTHSATPNVAHQRAIDALEILRQCPEVVGATPRIVIVPGYTHLVDSVAGTVDVTSAAKAGGNTGQGALTLADPEYGDGVKAGVYEVRFTGGAKSASALADGDNTGDGTVGSLTADSTAPVGDWTLRCVSEAANAGFFIVIRPDGTVDPGGATVGVAYNGTNGLNFTIADGAEDFDIGDEFTVTVIHSIPAGGGSFSVTDPDDVVIGTGTVGVAFTGVVKFTIADGSPDFIVCDGFDLTVEITDAETTANPVVAALHPVLDGLKAVAFVDGPSGSLNAAVNWRETIQSDRIIALGVGVKVLEGAEIVTRPAAPRFAGLTARIDNANGGRPFQPIANRPLYGIVGTNRPIPFSITDGAVEGQLLLAADIGVIVRGEIGVDSAIADGGFVGIAYHNCAEGELWAQFHQIRGSDYIAVKLLQLARQFLGRAVTASTVEAWVNSIKFMLRDHKALDDILGYKVDFQKDLNSPEQVRLGHLTVTPHIEPAPVFKLATHRVLRYRPAVDALVDEIISRLGTAA